MQFITVVIKDLSVHFSIFISLISGYSLRCTVPEHPTFLLHPSCGIS